MQSIYLDNSTINQLARYTAEAINKLRGSYKVHVSEYSVLECGATPDPEKRFLMFSALSQVGANVFEDPFDINKIMMHAYQNNDRSVVVDLDPRSGVWVILRDPGKAKLDIVRGECEEERTKLQEMFNECSHKAVLGLTAMYPEEKGAGKWLDFLDKRIKEGSSKILLDPIAGALGIPCFSEDEARRTLVKIPLFAYYVVAFLRYVYEAMRVVGTSCTVKNNVFIDIMQGVYLSRCDLFVCEDRYQSLCLQDVIEGVNHIMPSGVIMGRKTMARLADI